MLETPIVEDPLPRRNAQRAARLRKAKRWSGILAKFLSVQILVQAIGLVAGILLVRTLSQREYAFYTIANTMQATLILLADIGVGSALSATGGKVWQDRERFGSLIATGLFVRKRLAIISSLIALPVMGWMLHTNGMSLTYAAVLSLIVLVGAYFRLTNDVLSVVPLMRTQLGPLQWSAFVSAALRLALLAGACLLFVNAAVGVLVATLSLAAQGWFLHRMASDGANLNAAPNHEDKTNIWRVIRQMAPNTIYFCVQSQLTVFLISIFGSTKTIAEVGALGRLAVLFSLAGSVMSSIVIPKFARCQEKAQLKRLWWQIVGGTVLVSLLMLAAAVFAPRPFLWLLGKNYAHLNHELVYIVFGTVVGSIVGTVYSLNLSRAWMSGAWVSILVTVVVEVGLIPFTDLKSVKGVVLLTAFPAIAGVIPYLYRAHKEFQKMSYFVIEYSV